MSVRVTGLIETQIMLAELSPATKRRAVGKLHEKALEIAKLARKMAPVDKANLEKAIKVFPEILPLSRERNDQGQFVRQDIFVYVDTTMPAPASGHQGKTVGDYAYIMHEHLTPFGPLNLGELSAAKQAGQGEVVGGKYLERAMNEVGDSVLGAVSISVIEHLGY